MENKLKFCTMLTGKEEAKTLAIGQGDCVIPTLHVCLQEQCVAYIKTLDGRGKCSHYHYSFVDYMAESEDIMGTIRNEMTIVHYWNKDKLEYVREDAIKFFNEVTHINVADLMISPIMQSYINREYTFVINGDCSKIGWEISKQFHEARMKWCEKHKHDVQNIIVINFGDDGPCRIVFDNKANKAESEE